ncbi:MAG: LON peptidase substrate-binding domain-containing protein [Aquisalinus sp.]|nr:LON peptidase substrate-binding domain-containing protein [Aquisalinus sp.]
MASDTERVGLGRQLPDLLPIFPLRNALLLPRGRLPLNIFEPRYLMMTDHALASGRLIGMVRPQTDDNPNRLYQTGCAGRVTSFMETDDGRYLITLTGISRFLIGEEVETDTAFRQARPDWSPYAMDLWEPEHGGTDPSDIRSRLLEVLLAYLNEAGLKADWDAIKDASVDSIVNSIAMSCPFEPDEQQAILEAISVEDRAHALVSLMEISVAESHADMSDPDKKPSRLQ